MGNRSKPPPSKGSDAASVATGPVVTGPVVTGPVVTGPVVTRPVVTQISLAEDSTECGIAT